MRTKITSLTLCLALFAVALASACANVMPTDTNPNVNTLPSSSPTSSPVTFFPVQLEKYATEPYPASLAVGKLVLDNGCLRLSGSEGELIIWPAGFSIRTDNGVIQVFNEGMNLLFNLGDTTKAGGGEVPASILEKYTGLQVPLGFNGPYWLAGGIELSTSQAIIPSTQAETPINPWPTIWPSKIIVSDGITHTVIVIPDPPMISLDESMMVFITGNTVNPAVQTRLISANYDDISWAITIDTPWIVVSPVSGMASPARKLISISADVSALSPGIYMGHITVIAAAYNSKLVIPVQLTIQK